MKRPLCIAGLLYAVFLAALSASAGPERFVFPFEGERRIVITGRAGQKEHGPEGGILCLTDITHYSAESAQTSIDQQNTDTAQSAGAGKRQQDTPEASLPEGALCYFPDRSLPAAGRLVTVSGRARPFRRATNPGTFDRQAYYRLQGLDLMLTDCVVLEESGKTDGYRETLFRLRCSLEESLYRLMDREDASVMSAMLLGSRKGIDRDRKELYQAAGIAHILAISGLHISFLGMFLYRGLQRLGCPAKAAALFCVPLVYSYGVLCGAGASGQRAVCMFFLQLGAVWMGRTYDMLTALAAAALLLLVRQPLYLFSSGFQFSFGAVLGLGVLLPALRETAGKDRTSGEKTAEKKGIKRGIRQAGNALLASLSVTLATLPVLMQNYYEIPLYSVLLNLLVLPLMSVLLPAGFAVLLTKALLPPAAAFCAFLCHCILSACELFSRWTLYLPFGVVRTGHAQPWQTAAYYALLCAALFCGKRRAGLVRGLLAAAAAAVLFLRLPEAPLRIHMLDVGQGDCFLIRTDTGSMLIDGGSSSEKNVGTYRILPVLKYYGITELDYVFITHPDSDHYNGVEEILNQASEEFSLIKVGTLVLPSAAAAPPQDEAVKRLARLTEKQGGSVCVMEAGEILRKDGVIFRCLHPLPREQVSDRNDTSLVLSVEYGRFRGVFMGDLSMAHEEEVIKELSAAVGGETGCTLLKAGHHGSEDATGEELLKRLNPDMVLLSYGAGNRYGHPHAALLERIGRAQAKIYAAPDCGEVTICTDGRRVRTSCYADCGEE